MTFQYLYGRLDHTSEAQINVRRFAPPAIWDVVKKSGLSSVLRSMIPAFGKLIAAFRLIVAMQVPEHSSNRIDDLLPWNWNKLLPASSALPPITTLPCRGPARMDTIVRARKGLQEEAGTREPLSVHRQIYAFSEHRS